MLPFLRHSSSVGGNSEGLLALLVAACGWINKIQSGGELSKRTDVGPSLFVHGHGPPDPMMRPDFNDGWHTQLTLPKRRLGRQNLRARAQWKQQEGAAKLGSGFHKLSEGSGFMGSSVRVAVGHRYRPAVSTDGVRSGLPFCLEAATE